MVEVCQKERASLRRRLGNCENDLVREDSLQPLGYEEAIRMEPDQAQQLSKD